MKVCDGFKQTFSQWFSHTLNKKLLQRKRKDTL